MKIIILLLSICLNLFLFADENPPHECTSWMIFSDSTESNANILHKNRDNSECLVALIKSKENSPRKWIGSATATVSAPTMGINSSGLAVAVNSGEIHTDKIKKSKGNAKNTIQILQYILENCDTAQEAVIALEKIIKADKYYHHHSGSIFLFLDTKEGYICENTEHFIVYRKYNSSYAYRANRWLFPEIAKYANSTPKKVIGSSVRELTVRQALNSALRHHGKISIYDIINLARNNQSPHELHPNALVCNKHTLSTMTMEIDKEFPDVLSTAYTTIGHPRHTIVIPFPICIETIPEIIKNGSWSQKSFNRLKKSGNNSPIPQEWTDFEKTALEKYKNAKNQARTLLKENKKEAAIKLLNDTTAEIFKSAKELL